MNSDLNKLLIDRWHYQSIVDGSSARWTPVSQSVTSGYEEARFRNSEGPRLLDLVTWSPSVFYHIKPGYIRLKPGNYLVTWHPPDLSYLSNKKVEETR